MNARKIQKQEKTFFREAIPSILADTNAVLVETFALQEDHLQIKDIQKENSIMQILTYRQKEESHWVEIGKSIHSATQNKFHAFFK